MKIISYLMWAKFEDLSIVKNIEDITLGATILLPSGRDCLLSKYEQFKCVERQGLSYVRLVNQKGREIIMEPMELLSESELRHLFVCIKKYTRGWCKPTDEQLIEKAQALGYVYCRSHGEIDITGFGRKSLDGIHRLTA